MSAIAAVKPTRVRQSSRQAATRVSDRPTCTVCADSMIAAEASAFGADNSVSYLWTCDTCGYGFVTKHAMPQLVCN